jgi:hypothetical protein
MFSQFLDLAKSLNVKENGAFHNHHIASLLLVPFYKTNTQKIR